MSLGTIRITDALSNYAQATLDFATSGIVMNHVLLTYVDDHESRESLETRLRDGERAQKLLKMLLLSNAVDNFQTYLSELLYSILEAKPQILSGKQFKAAWLFDVADLESLKRRVIDKSILDLGYQNVMDLSDYFNSHLSIEIAEGKLSKLQVARLFQIRNIVAHNRGIVNQTFLFKTGCKHDKLGEAVRIPHPITASKFMGRLANRIDQQAMQKFTLSSSHVRRADA